MPRPEATRVGYVLKMYPRLSETFIVNEIIAHENVGLKVEIFSLRPPIDGPHELLGRVQAPVTYISHDKLAASTFWKAIHDAAQTVPNVWSVLREEQSALYDEMHQALLLAKLVQTRGITHLHAHFGTTSTSVARLASRMTGVPYSFTAHAKDIFHESIDHLDMRRKLADAKAVVTVSDFNLDYLRSTFADAADSVIRIYNGLDLDEFAFHRPIDRPPVILAVGRLVEKKGFDDLIEACGLLRERGREFQCRIIGDGAMFDSLNQQIQNARLAEQVSLLGPLPRSQVITNIYESAMLVAPCIIAEDGNRDGMPTVLLESMALGTPCISTRVVGIPELVRDGVTGLLCEQRDTVALADRMEELLMNPALGTRFAETARGLIEQEFDIHKNAAKVREIFSADAQATRRPMLEAV